jgi:hypothetical protein
MILLRPSGLIRRLAAGLPLPFPVEISAAMSRELRIKVRAVSSR